MNTDPVLEAEVLCAVLVGDALGRPFVGLKQGRIEALLGGERPEGFLTNPILLPDKPDRNMLPGLHGWLGQALLAAAASRADDGAGRTAVARTAAAWMELAEPESPGNWRDLPRPLAKALARWKEAYPWEEEEFRADGEPSEESSGLVAGLVSLALPEAHAAEHLARLTHRRAWPVMGACALAIAVRLASQHRREKRFPGAQVAEQMLVQLKELEAPFEERNHKAWRELGWGRPPVRLSAILSPLPSLLREAHDELAVKSILAASEAVSLEGQAPTHMQHPFAPTLLMWCLYRGLGGLSGRLAVEDAMARGGESSIAAAIVAALMVARHGPETLPDEWYAGTLALPVLRDLLAGKADAAGRWSAAEAAWNGQEKRLREPLEVALRKHQALQEERDRKSPRKTTPGAQGETEFAPPPELWLKPGEEEDPEKKKIMRALRGKKRIDWKEERHHRSREEE